MMEHLEEFEKIQQLQIHKDFIENEKEKRKQAALERLQVMNMQRFETHQKWKQEQKKNSQLKQAMPLYKRLEDEFNYQ